jgi:hypothetical protein
VHYHIKRKQEEKNGRKPRQLHIPEMASATHTHTTTIIGRFNFISSVKMQIVLQPQQLVLAVMCTIYTHTRREQAKASESKNKIRSHASAARVFNLQRGIRKRNKIQTHGCGRAA